MKAYGGSGAALPILKLDNRWQCFFSLLPRSFCSGEAPTLPTEYGARCAPEPAFMLWKSNKISSSGRERPDLACILDIMPTTLFRFQPIPPPHPM